MLRAASSRGSGSQSFKYPPVLINGKRQFTLSLAKQGSKLSPKQQAVFDHLYVTHLKEEAQ
jgi:hypothetical protein